VKPGVSPAIFKGWIVFSRTAWKIKSSGMYGGFGFFGASAEKKHFLQSGLRPEILKNFSNPQAFPAR